MNISQLVPTSSISKKIIMALTGFVMIGFLVTHLAGNMLLFVGAEAYNLYAHKLISNPLIYLAEGFLLAVFLYHVIMAIKLTLKNRQARPTAYAMKVSLGKRTFASSTMMWSGTIILIFLILHLLSFKFGEDVAPPSSEGVRDLYSLVVAKFHNPFFSVFYLICIVILGCHLSHALQSLVRTLGLSHPTYLGYVKVISYIVAIFFTVGYSIFPIYFGFIK